MEIGFRAKSGNSGSDERADIGMVSLGNFDGFGGTSNNVGSGGNVGGMGATGQGGEFARLNPQVRNPLLNVVNFYLPQDRKVLNQWLRYYDRFHPYVGNILDMHAESIVSPFELENVDNTEAMKLYKRSVEDCDLFNQCTAGAREIFLIGEWFPYLQWDETEGYFNKMVSVDPDYVHIHPHPFVTVKDAATFEIEPSQLLQDFVNSTDPIDLRLQRYLDPRIKSAIASGKFIKASSFNMTAVMKKASEYDIRGTSIVLRVLKDLMYEDKLREAQYAIADGHIAPRWLFQLGDQQRGLLPRKKDIQQFRKLIMSGWYDQNFTLITTYAFKWEALGSQGKILPLVPEFEFVADRVMVGLFAHKAALTGEGPTYANAAVARIITNARYQNRRSMIEAFIQRKIFTPIAKAHKFYKAKTISQKKHASAMNLPEELEIPRINWMNKLDLTDSNDFRQYLIRLREKGDVPMKTIASIFGLDYKELDHYLIKERGSMFDQVYRDYRTKHAESYFEKNEGAGGGGAPPGGPEGGGAMEMGGGEAPAAIDAGAPEAAAAGAGGGPPV